MASTTLNTATVSVQETFALSLTDRAVDKVKDFAAKMPDAADKALRVFVQAGGCSGFQYASTSSPSAASASSSTRRAP